MLTPSFDPKFLEWENSLYEAISDLAECDRSDAQAITEVQPDLMKEYYDAGLSPKDAAAKYLNK